VTGPATTPPRPREHTVRIRLFVAAAAVYVPFYVLFFYSDLPFSLPHVQNACAGQPVLDVRWVYGPDDAYSLLSQCGPLGRAAIRNQQLADLVYPAVNGVVVALGLRLLVQALAPGRRQLQFVVVIPVLAAVLDYLENLGIWTLLLTYPTRLDGVVRVLALITPAKLALGQVSLILVGLLLLTLVLMHLWVAAGLASQRTMQRQARALRGGGTTALVAIGVSMTPAIGVIQRVQLEPARADAIRPRDVVLARVCGRFFLHRVLEVDWARHQALIGDEHGGITGWTPVDEVYGRTKLSAGRA